MALSVLGRGPHITNQKESDMEKVLGQDYAPRERKQFLRDNADAVEQLGYQKPLTEDQLVELKEELTDTSIKIADIEAAKREATIAYNEELKPFKKRYAEVVDSLKSRTEFKEEDCYKFIDHEAGDVGYYNEEGVLVYQRGILPNERQKTVFEMLPGRQKTGTDN